jgi:murein DD-endopeptidase MepM/ murein hydrolase activator NlpD
MAKPLKEWKVTKGYGEKYAKFGGIHKGIDGAAKVGTPVYASVSGIVVHAGPNSSTGWGPSFGTQIIVDNDRFKDGSPGYWAGYCHLSKVKVKANQKVRKGQLIGWTGNTGRSTGPHLHLQILKTRFWNPTKHANPQKWLNA